MEVIYKERILDKMNKAIHDAETCNQEVEEIILTKDEWEEFVPQISPMLYYRGVKISKED